MPADVPKLLDYAFHRIAREDFEQILRRHTRDKKSCFVSPRSGATVCADQAAAAAYETAQRRSVSW